MIAVFSLSRVAIVVQHRFDLPLTIDILAEHFLHEFCKQERKDIRACEWHLPCCTVVCLPRKFKFSPALVLVL